MEQEEYKREAIDWSYIEFVDNQDVLDLIEKVIALFSEFTTWREEGSLAVVLKKLSFVALPNNG